MTYFWVSILLVAAPLSFGQAPVSGNSDNGKRLFDKDGCYECHGYAGQGGRDGARIAAIPLNLAGFLRYVRRPSGSMPAFTQKVVSDQELTDIYTFLKAFPAAKASKDIPLLDQTRGK